MIKFLKRVLAGFGYSIKPRYRHYFWGNKSIVKRRVLGVEMYMPKDHTIAYNVTHFPYYNTNLQRVAKELEAFSKSTFSIIDVGANIGDTLVMLRQVTTLPVHCFEGDPYYFSLLEKNSMGIANCVLHNMLLSDKKESAQVINQTALGTTEFTTGGSKGKVVNFETLDDFFVTQYPNERVKILKTDTDGFDIKIIRGAGEILKRDRPVLFLEYDRSLFEKNSDNGPDFFSFLQHLGYEGLVVYDNYGKLLCATRLNEEQTVQSLHSYIKNGQGAFAFYDLAVFHSTDNVFLDEFVRKEIGFFEQ